MGVEPATINIIIVYGKLEAALVQADVLPINHIAPGSRTLAPSA